MPTLYTHPLSNFAQRVHIALHEKNVRWDTVVVDMPRGAHRKPEYLAINPYGKVPALVEGDRRLYESSAILEYLEELHPTPPLFPRSPEERAWARALIKAADLAFTVHVPTIIFPKRFVPESKWRTADMAAALAPIDKHLQILARVLEGHEWAVGTEFGMVELCYAPFLSFLPIIDVTVPPAVDRWARRIFDRPSVQATRLADQPAWK